MIMKKATPELRAEIKKSGKKIIKMTLEDFKLSLGNISTSKPKINKLWQQHMIGIAKQ
jgi:hypothetical protein